jgi:glyoxylase-like metal-dependent hydrolase (beta-lactamase superfamily II)
MIPVLQGCHNTNRSKRSEKMRDFNRRTFISMCAAGSSLAPQLCSADSGPSSGDASKEDARIIPPNVRPPAQQALLGVYASRASETTYLIRCGERSVLIDAGYLHNATAHLANFESAGIDLGSVAAVLVTHCHVDHAAGLARVRDRLGCPVVAHKNTAPVIQRGDPVITAAQMPYLGWDFPFPPCEVDEIVEDGDTISVGDTSFTVVHIPGHTPGCVGYLWKGNMVVGDVLFADGRLGWADVHWGSNYLDTIDTMDRIAKLSPKYLLPTHGLPYAYDPTISEKGQAAAEHLLEDGRAGILAHTHRAEMRSTEDTPRALQL